MHHWWVIMRHVHFHLLIPGARILVMVGGHHLLNDDLEHMQPPGGLCFSPVRCCHLAHSVTESSNSCFTLLARQIIRILLSKHSIIISEFIRMGLLVYLICYETNSFLRSNVMWNNKMVNWIFFKSIDSSSGRSTAFRQEKSM